MRYIALIMLALTLVGCSGGPSPAAQMKAWESGKGGKALHQVHGALAQVVTDLGDGNVATFAGDGFRLEAAAANAMQYAPPADPAAYKKVMGDELTAGMDLTKLAGDPGQLVAPILNGVQSALGRATATLKGAPTSWASQL